MRFADSFRSHECRDYQRDILRPRPSWLLHSAAKPESVLILGVHLAVFHVPDFGFCKDFDISVAVAVVEPAKSLAEETVVAEHCAFLYC